MVLLLQCLEVPIFIVESHNLYLPEEGEMQVTVWHSGENIYGIRVGKSNRDKYFNHKWKSIEVEIEGCFHRFNLTNGFWHRCPEFRDRGTPIIREWLRSHQLLNWPSGQPPKIELNSLGEGKFRLVS